MKRMGSFRKLHGIVMALFACALTAAAQGASPAPDARAADEAAIRENVRQMEEGWNTKSGARFAKPFAEDADYVVINGLQLRGRAAIADAHQRIFDTIYKDSTVSLNVKQLRFLRADVAVAHLGGRHRRGTGEETQAIITLVLLQENGAWKITAFQNTQVAR